MQRRVQSAFSVGISEAAAAKLDGKFVPVRGRGLFSFVNPLALTGFPAGDRLQISKVEDTTPEIRFRAREGGTSGR